MTGTKLGFAWSDKSANLEMGEAKRKAKRIRRRTRSKQLARADVKPSNRCKSVKLVQSGETGLIRGG